MSEVLASDGVRLYAEASGSGTPLLLSPGYDYRGIKIEKALARVECPILLAAAPDDFADPDDDFL